MPVDNELYNRLSDTWWDDDEALSTLRTWLNPVRFGYFRRLLIEQQRIDPQGTKVLDVGCGGGLLAEEFACLGCQVTGIDPSEPSLATARKHAQQSGLDISYQVGLGEQLPFADTSFDIVVCCDVLEHVDNVAQVIQEISRVLKPDGLFFYDTINRTLLSWLAAIKMAQEWSITRFMPPNLHDWKKFIKPQELQLCMQKCHLQSQEVKGMSPSAHPLLVVSLFLRHKRGKITLTEMGKHMNFLESNDLSTSYMGYALKQ
ncbi:MAG TPA: bifunctional 2-polyprenyl-6-hydroxyphenol methylase/3-demethylubiquinol 3-O-methyltransferase UbiG [Ktedonobacteraceae bacterium]|jgi:2-polyprenyl-6-hydroxyphenyl methylase/3-demethylubiquinone-9 3-methyltransferase